MPYGRGRGGGRVFSGRGFAPWGMGAFGYGGYSAYGYPYFGGGRGNPYPFCRNFPWLPRWWWATPYASQYAGAIPSMGAYPYTSPYAGNIPYPGAYPGGQPYAFPYAPAYGASGQPVTPSQAQYGRGF